MKNSDERCSSCRFYRPRTDDYGLCCYDPPELTVGGAAGDGWPKVLASDWCGEWDSETVPPSNTFTGSGFIDFALFVVGVIVIVSLIVSLVMRLAQ
jgi:hypothetical protein